MTDRAVWEKVIKGRAGIRWDSAVWENVWKDVGGNQEEAMSAEKFGRYKTKAEERIKIGEKGRA